ncbi:MAG: hypothetical protein FJ014_18095 [Chloroflexi bacterium]|nr:hypothetical protein [Chloroflexota bacterium]
MTQTTNEYDELKAKWEARYKGPDNLTDDIYNLVATSAEWQAFTKQVQEIITVLGDAVRAFAQISED